MRIRCDWEKCSNKCRYYSSCILHHPTHSNILRVEEELSWNVNRLNELSRGINQYKQELFQYDDLPKMVREHLAKETLQELIHNAEEEKETVQSRIRELQIKELNMRKILQRR